MATRVGLRIRRCAARFLEELDAGWLSVCKIHGRQGGYVRCVLSVNADWYRSFCKAYTRRHSRRHPRPRTIIKRQSTRRALGELMSGVSQTLYAERLCAFITHWMEHNDERGTMPTTADYQGAQSLCAAGDF